MISLALFFNTIWLLSFAAARLLRRKEHDWLRRWGNAMQGFVIGLGAGWLGGGMLLGSIPFDGVVTSAAFGALCGAFYQFQEPSAEEDRARGLIRDWNRRQGPSLPGEDPV